MTVRFSSTVTEPRSRGEEFGETFRDQVTATVEGYRHLFARSAGSRTGPPDLDEVGARVLGQVEGWTPALAQEIRGIAAGAGLPAPVLAAVNARTEVLARLRRSGPGECSTVVALGRDGEEPVAMQNWDWYAGMSDGWLVWDLQHPDGRRTSTLTEYGIVGKIGINDAGVGCLVNILHHRKDGGRPGVPVHVIARRVLDEGRNVASALRIIGSARVSASTTITVVGGLQAGKTAISAELWPDGPSHVLPDPDGLLLHTNHFLSPHAAAGDTEPVTDPDTLVRYEVLRRALTGTGGDLTADRAHQVLQDHTGGTGALCCHPDPSVPAQDQFATLASVRLDFATCSLQVHDGTPCRDGLAAA